MTLTEMTVQGFLREVASASPAPGGGSAAALAGAVAAALCAMAARLTLGREKYRGSWAEMEAVRTEADGLAERLARLVDEDIEAFTAAMAARGLPRETGAQKAARAAAAQEAVLWAARVPLETLKAVARVAVLAASAAARGNPACLTDAGSAAELARAGAAAASYNVGVNLGAVGDPALRADLARQAADALELVMAEADRVKRLVNERLG
jgi:glutamate formiminotransferase/formiminotetrahydrofolate cyclodeaminase